MESWVIEVLIEALEITSLVFGMMVALDIVNVATKGRIKAVIQGGRGRQYIIASFVGATPGCFGAFTNVSLYVHGGLTFGAIVGGMIATSGDEAFVMLAMFPRKAVLLFVVLFVAGVLFGWLTDRIVPRLHIRVSEDCQLDAYHEGEETGGHYIRLHVWIHIVRTHLWKVFLWTSSALVLVHIGLEYWDMRDFVTNHMMLVLLLSGLIAVIPQSGSHLIFVMLFAEGVVPFSVLFVSSFVQDGHALLPLLAHSLKDAVLIKLFSTVFGLGVGIVLYGLGL